MKAFSMGAIITLIFSATFVFAGPRITGNGGDAVVCRNPDGTIKSAELLDYYEARAERGIISQLDPKKSMNENLYTLIQNSIYEEDDQLALEVQGYLKTFQDEALFLDGIELIDIPDSKHLTFPKGCKVEQAAVQSVPKFSQDKRYKFSNDIWLKMDSANQAGLIFHELLYRLLIDQSKPSEDLNSISIRYVNSLASSNSIIKLSENEYIKSVLNTFSFYTYKKEGFIIRTISIHDSDDFYSYCGRYSDSKKMNFNNTTDNLKFTVGKENNICIKKNKKNNITEFEFHDRLIINGIINGIKMSTDGSIFILRVNAEGKIIFAEDIFISAHVMNQTSEFFCDKFILSSPTKSECVGLDEPKYVVTSETNGNFRYFLRKAAGVTNDVIGLKYSLHFENALLKRTISSIADLDFNEYSTTELEFYNNSFLKSLKGGNAIPSVFEVPFNGSFIPELTSIGYSIPLKTNGEGVQYFENCLLCIKKLPLSSVDSDKEYKYWRTFLYHSSIQVPNSTNIKISVVPAIGTEFDIINKNQSFPKLGYVYLQIKRDYKQIIEYDDCSLLIVHNLELPNGKYKSIKNCDKVKFENGKIIDVIGQH